MELLPKKITIISIHIIGMYTDCLHKYILHMADDSPFIARCFEPTQILYLFVPHCKWQFINDLSR